MPRIHASVIEAAPPKALPVGAAPADLEALLLRVLTAEQQQRVSSTPPSLAVLCDELEAAGFSLLGERDMVLAETLQPTAAERLEVRPQLGRCDPSLATELEGAARAGAEVLNDGRVLIYRRGYSSEEQEGRLLLEVVFERLNLPQSHLPHDIRTGLIVSVARDGASAPAGHSHPARGQQRGPRGGGGARQPLHIGPHARSKTSHAATTSPPTPRHLDLGRVWAALDS